MENAHLRLGQLEFRQSTDKISTTLRVPGAAEVIHLEPRCQRRRPHFIHGCPDAVIRLYIMKCLRLLQSADIDTCMYGVQVEDDTPAQSTGEQQDR